jgi:hypothetical protein
MSRPEPKKNSEELELGPFARGLFWFFVLLGLAVKAGWLPG